MATKICTNCGYEGQAIKRPDDAYGEKDNETQKAFTKVANIFSVITFVPVKPLAMLISLPFYLVLWPIKRLIKGDGKKWCPNCGLPLMVSLKSDAGWLAKRKNDIKSGAVVIERKEAPKVAFGKEIALGDEVKQQPVIAPRPEKLPSLEALLAPEETNSVEAADTAEKHVENTPKKPPANPDEW